MDEELYTDDEVYSKYQFIGPKGNAPFPFTMKATDAPFPSTMKASDVPFPSTMKASSSFKQPPGFPAKNEADVPGKFEQRYSSSSSEDNENLEPRSRWGPTRPKREFHTRRLIVPQRTSTTTLPQRKKSSFRLPIETINQPGNANDKNRIIGTGFGSRLNHPAHPPSRVEPMKTFQQQRKPAFCLPEETINQSGNTNDKNRIIGNRFGSRFPHPAHPPSRVLPMKTFHQQKKPFSRLPEEAISQPKNDNDKNKIIETDYRNRFSRPQVSTPNAASRKSESPKSAGILKDAATNGRQVIQPLHSTQANMNGLIMNATVESGDAIARRQDIEMEFERASKKLLEARNYYYRVADEIFKKSYAELFETKEIELNAV